MARKSTGPEVGLVGETNGIDVIWLRLGDADDYHAFDGLNDVAEALVESGVETVGGEKENVVYTQQIEYTDFPLDTVTLYNDGGILCLPGER